MYQCLWEYQLIIFTSQRRLWAFQQDMASSGQASISTGMGSASLMNHGVGFQGTARHPVPTSKGANWLGDSETLLPEGRHIPAIQTRKESRRWAKLTQSWKSQLLFRRWAALSPVGTTQISASSCQGSYFLSEIPCVGICRLPFQQKFLQETSENGVFPSLNEI